MRLGMALSSLGFVTGFSVIGTSSPGQGISVPCSSVGVSLVLMSHGDSIYSEEHHEKPKFCPPGFSRSSLV
ncbi:hypothetical protein EMIT0324P_60220 [Pseudomonas chlororaphis]